MPSKVVSVRNVSKSYEIYASPAKRFLSKIKLPLLDRTDTLPEYTSKALQDISIDIYRGQSTGILGRNGSGKSTLLQLIMGTLSPTEGDIQRFGTVNGLLELGSGFNPEYSGIDNIFLNAALSGMSRSVTTSILEDIIAFADIGDYVNYPVKTYSSGMALRLAFASQIFIKSDVLIIDEALAVGDSKFQLKCHRKLDEIRESGSAILLVTHSVGVVRQFCDHALVLDHGKLVFEGHPSSACSVYNNLLFPVSDSTESAISPNPKDLDPPCTSLSTFTGQEISLALSSSYGDNSLVLDSVIVSGVDLSSALGSETIQFKLNYIVNRPQDPILSNPTEDIHFGIRLVSSTGITVFDTYGTSSVGSIVSTSTRYVIASVTLPSLSNGDYFISIGAAIGPEASPVPVFSYDDMIKLCVSPRRLITGLLAPDSNFLFPNGAPSA